MPTPENITGLTPEQQNELAQTIASLIREAKLTELYKEESKNFNTLFPLLQKIVTGDEIINTHPRLVELKAKMAVAINKAYQREITQETALDTVIALQQAAIIITEKPSLSAPLSSNVTTLPTKQDSPSKKNINRAGLKKRLWGLLAFVAVTAACITIGVAGFGVPLATMVLATFGAMIALTRAGIFVDSLKPASLKITPQLLNKLSKEPSKIGQESKLTKRLANALIIQWRDNPKLFEKNFKILKNHPTLMQIIVEASVEPTADIIKLPTIVSVIREPDSLYRTLIRSPKQSEAVEFVIACLRIVKNNNLAKANMPLFAMKSAILANNAPLARKLATEWPEIDFNDKNFERDHTLLMRLIEYPASVQQLDILLSLKAKDGSSLIDPDCLAGGFYTKTALETALRAKTPNIEIAQLLRQYGAKNYGSLSSEEINTFQAEMNRKAVPPHAQAAEKPNAHTAEPVTQNAKTIDSSTTTKKKLDR